MQTGKINVQTENIFPIIKKFLYSDHEIFLRELVSNAVDATQKIKTLAAMDKVKEELGDLTIEVILDKENGTLTVKDRGIGMTAEEVDKYINQIAFSGAEEFVKKFKGKSQAESAQLIGHFGLGFYSAFMVSKLVELRTKTYKKGAGTKAVKWTCDGSPEYTLEEIDKTDRGTEVVLHIADDSKEFLEESRILQLLNKYAKFLPIPIRFGNEKTWEKVEGEKDEKGNDKYEEIEKPRIINNTLPAWKKKPSELTDEHYENFYRELYPASFEEPLFNIHLNVDYPFNLTGILYFPRIKRNIELQKDKIQLYSNQVFVTDSVEGIVPEFLTILHGVLDSPDIPLNVSRSYLQSDNNVKKISNHIMKKVADKLEELFKNNREDFEKKWEDIRVFIEYGMMTEDAFFKRADKFFLFSNVDGKYFTMEEYKQKVSSSQTGKDSQVTYLYTTDPVEQHTFVKNAQARGYDVLKMDNFIDNHFINAMEQNREGIQFKRVDAEVADKLIAKDEEIPSKLSDSEKETLKKAFEEVAPKEQYHIMVENLSEQEEPVQIVRPEFMRRMKDMQTLGGGGMFMGDFPEMYNLVVNANSPVIYALNGQPDEAERKTRISHLFDLARLSQNLLRGEELSEFIRRTYEIINK